jgi:hypothetical protein
VRSTFLDPEFVDQGQGMTVAAMNIAEMSAWAAVMTHGNARRTLDFAEHEPAGPAETRA